MKRAVVLGLVGLVLVGAGVAFGAHELVGHGGDRRLVSSRYDYVWQAASRVARGCARRDAPSSDVDGLLWLRGGSHPLVFLLEEQLPKPDVVSSRGDHFAVWGEFWPCRTPVAIYMRPPSPYTVMTVLTSDRAQRKTIAVGRFRLAEGSNRNALAGYGNAIVAADGRVIFFDGTTIHYAGGSEFAAQGIPHGMQISALAVSPRDSSVFLANVVSNPNVPGGCRSNDEQGAVYLITPRGSSKLKGYDPCQGAINVQWSPDGQRVLWFLGADQPHLFVSDGLGRHLHELIDHPVCGALWSPDGRKVAYGYSCMRVHVLDLSTGESHFAGAGGLRAWSPDGQELALIRVHRPFYGSGFPGGSIVAVPATGGQARLLMKLPPKKF